VNVPTSADRRPPRGAKGEALQGLTAPAHLPDPAASRGCSSRPGPSRDDGWRRGESEAALRVRRAATRAGAGGGTVHHIAWAPKLTRTAARAATPPAATPPPVTPLLLPLDLLPRAQRRPRDRDPGAGIHRGRAGDLGEKLSPPTTSICATRSSPHLEPLSTLHGREAPKGWPPAACAATSSPPGPGRGASGGP
jgi:hypothetical protein